MDLEFTPGARRVLNEAARWSLADGPDELDAPALLLGLLAESECRAAILLERSEIDVAAVRGRWPDLLRVEGVPGGVRFSASVESSLAAATDRLQDCVYPLVLATEHVLLGLACADHETATWLRQHGIDPDALEREIYGQYGQSPGPLPFEERPIDMPQDTADVPPASRTSDPPSNEPSTRSERGSVGRPATTGSWTDSEGSQPHQIAVLRVIDAASNRAREGLRVVEDYVRFVLDDRHFTERLKQMRHDLGDVLRPIALGERMAARDTLADVGTQVATESESLRQDAADVVVANFTRVQESLRTLEEFAKIVDPAMAAELERLRYQSYTLQRAVQTTAASLNRLDDARLYLLVDGCASEDAFCQLVEALVDAGVDVLQLRDKELDDRRLLERARLLRDITQRGETLFVMNDRPDIAVLSRADGVHVGQEELSVKDARTIVGPRVLVGVSTHSVEQARQAVLDGANYIGVGPTFPSGTKRFDHFPGLDLLRSVAAEIRLPAFAIGGITHENVPDVLATGTERVAVRGTVTDAGDPGGAVRELKAALSVREDSVSP